MPAMTAKVNDGFVPPIFDETVLDRKFLVSASDSLRATRELTEREASSRASPRAP